MALEDGTTAVAERPAEVTQPESLASDSPPEQSTETPEVVEEEPDPDLVSYLETKGLTQAETEAKDATPGQKPQAVDPAVEARAQEIATQHLTKAQRQNEERGVALNFAGRAQAIREFTAPWVRGDALPTEMDIERLVATFNEHHAQSSRISAMNFLDGLYGQAEEFFPGIVKNRADHASLGDFLKDVQTRATSSGYVPEKQAKTMVKDALIERNKYLENNPDVLRAMLSKVSAPKPAGGSAGVKLGKMSLSEIEALPTSQWMNIPREQRQRLLDQARGAA